MADQASDASEGGCSFRRGRLRSQASIVTAWIRQKTPASTGGLLRVRPDAAAPGWGGGLPVDVVASWISGAVSGHPDGSSPARPGRLGR